MDGLYILAAIEVIIIRGDWLYSIVINNGPDGLTFLIIVSYDYLYNTSKC